MLIYLFLGSTTELLKLLAWDEVSDEDRETRRMLMFLAKIEMGMIFVIFSLFIFSHLS